MLALSLKTSQEANWNGQADAQDHILSQADALTNKRGVSCTANFFYQSEVK